MTTGQFISPDNNVFSLDGVVSVQVCSALVSFFDQSKAISSYDYSNYLGTAEPKAPLGAEHVDRKGTVLILDNPSMKDVVDHVYSATRDALFVFAANNVGIESLLRDAFVFTTPRLERIEPSGGFTWHMDSRHLEGDRRFLTALLYLNDVGEGGETEFLSGYRIRPVSGRILFIPPYWTHLHRGCAPHKERKYTLSFGVAASV